MKKEMKASYIKTKCGNYLPAIISKDGKTILHGDPLVTAKAAKKFAQIEINTRLNFLRNI